MLALVPPGQRSGQRVDLGDAKPERPPGITQRALGPVGNYRGRQRRPLATVFGVNVLNHFLAPLMLEIDVDIRRLATLFRDKTLEEQGRACRVNLGHAEGITDRRIGRRSAPLTENVLAAGKTDDVVDSQKIGFVAHLADQLQFVLYALTDAGWHRLRIAPAQTTLGFGAQPGSRRFTRRGNFFRIFVAQLIKRKIAQGGNLQGFGQHFRRIKARQAQPAAQMPLAIGKQRIARLKDRGFQTQGSHHILQRAPGAHMHMDIAGSHQRQGAGLTERLQGLQLVSIIGAGMQFNGNPDPTGKTCRQPLPVSNRCTLAGDPEQQTIRQRAARRDRLEIVALQCVIAFIGTPSGKRDKRRKIAVAVPVTGQKDKFWAIKQHHFATDDQLQAGLLRRQMRTHNAGQRAFIRQC